MGWGLRGRLSRCSGWGAWTDALCFHVGHQLVRDLSQHIPGQAGHAQYVVAGAVHVVPEGHKLRGRKTGVKMGRLGPLPESPLYPTLHFVSFPRDGPCLCAESLISTPWEA